MLGTTTNVRSRRTLRATLAGIVFLALLSPARAAAQESPSSDGAETGGPADFAVQPSGPDGPGGRDWFIYTLEPGDSFGDTVAISNLGERPIRFRIYATDAVSVEDVAGFGALRVDEEPTDVGTWIELGAEEYTVQPGRRVDVPFIITVPEDAEPGDHAGAILALDADEGSIDPNTAPDGVSLDVRMRLGARVYVRVGGEVAPALRIDELTVERDGRQATVTWDIANTGNVRLSPTATVRVTGWLGRTVRTMPATELPELLPGANYVGGTIVTGLPSMEPLTAHVVAEAEGVRTERSKQFAGYPWLLLAGIAAILLLLAGLIVRRRRRNRRSQPAPGERQVPVPA